VLAAAGREVGDLDAEDWWFRTTFAPGAPKETMLRLDGLATVAEVFLNGERVLVGESMWARHAVDLGGRLREANELAIVFRALSPLLAAPRKPRARWRTQLVADGALRWYRTAIMGRAPGFSPGPAPVGPWREIGVEAPPALRGLRIRPRLEGRDGVLAVEADGGGEIVVELDGRRLALEPDGRGELRMPGAASWWPHTHGEPALHEVMILCDGELAATRRVGFRTLAAGATAGHDVQTDGLDLHVNGVRIFCRGAVWTPVDPVGLTADPVALRAALLDVRDAGMNMLRIPGTGVYEPSVFHDLCDELGILVWQDLMFANLDYPISDEGFRATVQRELYDELGAIAGRPSLAVVCGNSEIEQQVAMLGLDPSLGRGELFAELVPRALKASGADAVYVPSAPCGGALPFRPGVGIANYYGVGGYRRPLSDARLAGVRFAAECLAFANLPDSDTNGWVPRDAGADWDFADVRDHYLRELHGVDPAMLRAENPERYAALSRAVTGEVMAEVFGEWRRAASPCGGGLVLQLRDLRPGAGWGLVEHTGMPKEPLAHLRRALAPVAVWTTDEGLGGIAIHIANDRPEPLEASLRVALYREAELRVGEATEELEVPPHTVLERDAEALLGRFADASYAYRFGRHQHDVLVATLVRRGDLLAQAFRFPAGRPAVIQDAEALGLEARFTGDELAIRARKLVYGVRIAAPGRKSSDNAFSLEPSGERRIVLSSVVGHIAPLATVTLTALNLRGVLRVPTSV